VEEEKIEKQERKTEKLEILKKMIPPHPHPHTLVINPTASFY
jgi:hypothetical protein